MTVTTNRDEARAMAHGMWTTLAPAWSGYADEVDTRAAALTARMIESACVRRGCRVLELASGPGGAGIAAAELVDAEGEVVISDVVPAMVDVARQRAAARGLSNVRTEVLDLEDID